MRRLSPRGSVELLWQDVAAPPRLLFGLCLGPWLLRMLRRSERREEARRKASVLQGSRRERFTYDDNELNRNSIDQTNISSRSLTGLSLHISHSSLPLPLSPHIFLCPTFSLPLFLSLSHCPTLSHCPARLDPVQRTSSHKAKSTHSDDRHDCNATTHWGMVGRLTGWLAD